MFSIFLKKDRLFRKFSKRSNIYDIIDHLRQHPSDLHLRHSKTGDSLLHHYIQTGNRWVIVSLVSLGADLEARNAQGETPLIVAARLNKTKIVKELLDLKANPDAQDNNGNTALMVAAGTPSRKSWDKTGQVLSTRYLCQYGADPLLKNKQGQTVTSLVHSNWMPGIYMDDILTLFEKIAAEKKNAAIGTTPSEQEKEQEMEKERRRAIEEDIRDAMVAKKTVVFTPPPLRRRQP